MGTYSFPRMYALKVEIVRKNVWCMREGGGVVTHGTMFALLTGAASEIINPTIAARA